jgi:imidazoleglycerol phosphate synthase glutamine amidotransferase subunit HisH
MRFEVFTAVKIQVEVFLVVTPRNVMVGYQFHPEDGGSIEL